MYTTIEFQRLLQTQLISSLVLISFLNPSGEPRTRSCPPFIKITCAIMIAQCVCLSEAICNSAISIINFGITCRATAKSVALTEVGREAAPRALIIIRIERVILIAAELAGKIRTVDKASSRIFATTEMNF